MDAQRRAVQALAGLLFGHIAVLLFIVVQPLLRRRRDGTTPRAVISPLQTAARKQLLVSRTQRQRRVMDNQGTSEIRLARWKMERCWAHGIRSTGSKADDMLLVALCHGTNSRESWSKNYYEQATIANCNCCRQLTPMDRMRCIRPTQQKISGLGALSRRLSLESGRA